MTDNMNMTDPDESWPIPEGVDKQWVPPRASMTASDGLTAEFMHTLWRDGIIGYKEMRSWLANNFVSYAAIRDPAVDAMIDGVGREQFGRAHAPEEDNEVPEE